MLCLEQKLNIGDPYYKETGIKILVGDSITLLPSHGFR